MRPLLILTMVFAGSALPAADRPNVMIVLCDDLRWDTLGCAGHPQVKTPNIDRLANEGVHFVNAFCTTSLCSPSRASILSGQYAHSHGVVDNFTEYPRSLDSLPRNLQAAGYATAYIGKYHMGEENDEPRPGFDWFVTHKGQGKYFDTEFNLNGKERKVVPGYYTHVVTEMALDWLQKQTDEKPFFLMVGQKAPHSFYTPEPKYADAFESVAIPYPDSAFELGDNPAWYKTRLSTWHGIYGPLFDYRKKFPDSRPESVKHFEAMIRGYWGTVLSVDDSVGRMTRALEEAGRLDNTVFVFMGDNGLLNGEHGMVDKRTMHEPSIRIPLVIRAPQLTPKDRPRKETAQVLTLDLAPSLLELCGAAPLKQAHGRSWVSLVQGKSRDWRTGWLYEYNYEKQFPYTPNIRGVRTDEWKLIRYPHGDGGPDRHRAELYDLKNDPDERKNLIDDPTQRSRIEELSALIAAELKRTGATPDRMPIDAGIKQELPDLKIR
ncbi:Arylsulfatase [Caulifigura coniformis]|uniref:Arylsulfatase n=1 Tax=Caulifigura coniformis TaxID=2527983 RepID=A0A517SG24_9PLAN|nr:sulfatase [Caulifigura coniformis]QDT55079.1 Arylsulfatase [Caulifigura coniformis]